MRFNIESAKPKKLLCYTLIMGLRPRVFITLTLLMLIISYQNFSSVESSEWDSTNTLKIIDEMSKFEKKDPGPANTLASPENGSDLKSVSSDWVQRQSRILLNGYDKKLETAMNDKLNSWVLGLKSEERASESPDASSPAEEPSSVENADSSAAPKSRFGLRFARLNSLKYDFGENSWLDLTADPGNTRLNFSQAFNPRTRWGLEHRTANGQTHMILKYEW